MSYKVHLAGTKAGIPPGKSDASGGIGPKHIATSTSGFSARCRPMRPISPVEFQLKVTSECDVTRREWPKWLCVRLCVVLTTFGQVITFNTSEVISCQPLGKVFYTVVYAFPSA